MKITCHPYAPGKFSRESYLRSRLHASCRPFQTSPLLRTEQLVSLYLPIPIHGMTYQTRHADRQSEGVMHKGLERACH